jgi:putative two-component system response regulator
MTADRAWRPAFPVDQVVAHIDAQRGQAFDPAIVDAFHRTMPRILEIRRAFSGPVIGPGAA